MKSTIIATTLVAAIGLSEPSFSNENITNHLLGGALVGALAGAAIQSGGSWEEGARRGALGGAALGMLSGYGAQQRQRQHRYQSQYMQSFQPGSTSCTSVYNNGTVTERCTSSIVRPGYQNY